MTNIKTLEGVTEGTYRIVTESGTVLYANLDKAEAVRLPGAEPTGPGFISMMFDGGDGRLMSNFKFAYPVEVGAMMFASYDPTAVMTGGYRSTPVRSIERVMEDTSPEVDADTIL
jgi:hypothetical protein